MATPSPAVILENLDLDQMNRARLEINHSSAHIKSCSPYSKPGEGTEGNKRLHNTLSRSLLCGATVKPGGFRVRVRVTVRV